MSTKMMNIGAGRHTSRALRAEIPLYEDCDSCFCLLRDCTLQCIIHQLFVNMTLPALGSVGNLAMVLHSHGSAGEIT